MNSLWAIFFVLKLFTISLKTLSISLDFMSCSVCLIQGKGPFQVKREVHAACLTSTSPVVSHAQQFMKLNSFVCQTYHFPKKLKIWHKHFPITHKLKVLISPIRPSLYAYGPLNKIMCFVLINFTWIF